MNYFHTTNFMSDGSSAGLSVIIGADSTSTPTGVFRDPAVSELVFQIFGIDSARMTTSGLKLYHGSDTAASATSITMCCSAGSVASPAATTTNKRLADINAKAYITGVGYVAGGTMAFWQDGTSGSAAAPTACSFYLSDSTTTDTEVMRLSGTGTNGTVTVYGQLNHNGSLIKFFNGTARTKQEVLWNGLSDSTRLENLKAALVTLNLIYTDET